MFFVKDKGEPIYAAMSGHVVSIGDVDEPIFAGKVVVSFISDQKHSYGITGDNGIEVLLHIGIDTVKLEGEGFTSLVKKGDRVEAGQPICKVDLDFLRQKRFDITSPLIITSGSVDRIKRLTLRTGQAVAGETVCMRYVVR